MRLSLLLSISLALSHAVASAYANEDSTFPKLAATQNTKDTKAATSYFPDLSEAESFWSQEAYCYDDKDYLCYK